MKNFYAFLGMSIALIIELILMTILVKKIHPKFSIPLIGLITILILIALSFYFPKHYFVENYLTVNGAVFTMIGAVFTVINTIIVIYLMIWLHKKDSSLALMAHFHELQKELIIINKFFKSELEYFETKQSDLSENLYFMSHEESDPEHKELYQLEISNLNTVIKSYKDVFTLFIDFRDKLKLIKDVNLTKVQKLSSVINSLNEIFALKSPEASYKKSYSEGADLDADPKDQINAAKQSSLTIIGELKIVFEVTDVTT